MVTGRVIPLTAAMDASCSGVHRHRDVACDIPAQFQQCKHQHGDQKHVNNMLAIAARCILPLLLRWLRDEKRT